MSGSPEFRIDVYQNEYLPEGASLVNAIVTVTSQAGAAPATAGTVDRRLAEAIIVDCSGSMDYPRSKIQAAKRATSTAIRLAIDVPVTKMPLAVSGKPNICRVHWTIWRSTSMGT